MVVATSVVLLLYFLAKLVAICVIVVTCAHNDHDKSSHIVKVINYTSFCV